MNYQQLLEEAKQFVLLYFKNHNDKRYVYHNKNHTQDVVAAVAQIANHYQLNDEDYFAVSIAAWFHDIGYSGGIEGHEARGANMAAEFLSGVHISDSIIEKIKGCILATKMPQHPMNLLENIVCDADLFHLGNDDFLPKSKLIRKETELVSGQPVDKQQWRQRTIDLMENHSYHTDYCRLLLNDKKEANLDKIKTKQAEMLAKMPATAPPDKQLKELQVVRDKAELPKKKEKPEKGIETMFRNTAANHQRLSNMADSKAHIMISVNSIVISLVVSLLLRKIEDHERQIVPAIVLLAINLVAIVFAILATRPNLPPGTYTQEDIDQRRVNLLFFGNFYKMNLDQYTKAMFDMMNDRDFLYGSLIRDLYSEGVVLGRKYKLLRISYSVFMYGIVASVIAFVLTALL